MSNQNSDRNTTWRSNWFVVNVLAEIPIAGSFFKESTLANNMYEAGKCIAALAGGTTAMMLVDPQDSEHMQTRLLKVTSSMVLGMSIGKAMYNSAYSGGSILYHYLSKQLNSSRDGLEEEIELMPSTSNIVRNNISSNTI